MDRRDARHVAAEEERRASQQRRSIRTPPWRSIQSTGKLKWYHQYLENDTWDLDYVYERMLVDLPFNGETRKMLVTAGKLGIIEALDRTNGRVAVGEADGAAERGCRHRSEDRREDNQPGGIPHIGKTTVNCPADPGGRGWPATAYNPNTQTLYPAAQRVLLQHHADAARSRPGLYRRRPCRLRPHSGPGSDGNVGRVDAIKLTDRPPHGRTGSARRRPARCCRPRAASCSPARWDRYFRAWDDATGKVLWQIRTNNAVNGFPISYSVNGKQYMAVSVGNGRRNALARNADAGRREPDGGSVLWVFALPD